MEIRQFLENIQNDKLVLNTVYDIGASDGAWINYVKSSLFTTKQIYLFEANQTREKDLQSTGLPYFIGVLSSPDKEFVDFYSQTSTGDSYYKENTLHYDDKRSTRVSCKTLSSIIKEHNLPIPNFIKLDTQGSEIDILKGAVDILNKVDLIFLECPVVRYNLGAPNIQEYLDFMKEYNFIPHELLDVQRCENTVFQLDIMFINYETKKRLYGPNKYIRALDSIKG